MNVNEKKSSHLKLVKQEPERMDVELSSPGMGLAQADLFPIAKPWLLIFTDTSELSADNFVALLDQAQPTFVLDVRPTPHFDIGRLNRRQVFEIFRLNLIHYVDVAGLVGVSSRWDANLNPLFLADTINIRLLRSGAPGIEGPIIILCDNKEFLNSAMEIFPKMLLKSEKQQWDVYLAPLRSPTPTRQA